jgi:hypothetical protein
MNFTTDQVDKGIYEAIRLVLVESGYTPDVVIYNTEALYKAQLLVIKANGKNPVNLYGVGSWKAKEELKFSTIVIERTREGLSPIGYRGTTYFEPDGAGKFDMKQVSFETTTITYTISMVVKNSSDEKTVSYLLRKALGVTRELKGLNVDGTYTTGTFRIFRDDIVDVGSESMIEKKMIYKTSELILEEDRIIGEKVSPITDIEFDLNEEN